MRGILQVDENGVITESKFKTFGCGSAIASSSLVTEWVQGKTVDEVRWHGLIATAIEVEQRSNPPYLLFLASSVYLLTGPLFCALATGADDPKQGHRGLPKAAARKAALLNAGRGRHQGGRQGLQGQEREAQGKGHRG